MTTDPALVESAGGTAPAGLPAVPGWERWSVRAVLAVFVAVGIHCIHNLAFMGQDYSVHVMCTEHLINHPDQWFSFDYTNRPVPYWIGMAWHWFTLGQAGNSTWQLASLTFLLLNAFALHLLHATARRFITSPLVRLSALAFIAFLPSGLVTSVVYAADATAQLPFVLLILFLLRAAEAGTERACAGYAALAGLVLGAGNLAKYTFLLLPAASLVITLLLWRWRRLNARRGLLLLGLAVVLPALVGCWVKLSADRATAQNEPRHLLDWKGVGEMTWRSVLLPKKSDARIFKAPGYFDPSPIPNAGLPLLYDNSYSYPALLHLAVFTDVLDYANQGATINGKPRPKTQKSFSQVAVWLGLMFSVPAFLAVVAFAGRTVLALFWPRLAPNTGTLVWGVTALVWYLPLVIVLPYLHNAYAWGYWLPRLILPALWGFALILFATADGLLARHVRATYALAGLVLVQAVVHIGSIWY